MVVLLLDPFALTLLLGLLLHVWLVWRGTLRGWFGRAGGWTVLAWPVPLLVIAVPPLAAVALRLAELAGLGAGVGEVAGALLYLAAFLLPAAVIALSPPRWLLPAWARRRLVTFPDGTGPQAPMDAIAAVRARRGHGSRARWVWRVDGIAGHVWIDGATLHFRSCAPTQPDGPFELDEDATTDLRFDTDGELRLQPPRGGWWHPGHAEVELAHVDAAAVGWLVPWRRDGLLRIEVAGRRPLTLWVAEVRALRDRLAAHGPDPSSGSPPRERRPV